MVRIPVTDGVPPAEQAVVAYLPDACREECERQGWWAYCFGLSFNQNPYHHTTRQYIWWDEGWNEGLAESH